MKKQTWLLVGVWWIIAAVTAVWSYHLVDPNLTLFSFPWYVEWQTGMWAQAKDAVSMTWQYAVLLAIWWGAYAAVIKVLHREPQSVFPAWVGYALLGSSLLLLAGYNALSHDIFNYIFNAKMVVIYGANPHLDVALQFDYDPWVRFMHNIHTPAPYGWGWTLLSIIPFLVSGGKFVLAYFGMKAWMAVGWFLYAFLLWKLVRKFFPGSALWRWALGAFHPLILIETLLNGHNDLWMMWPVLLMILIFWDEKYARKWWSLLLGTAVFVLSVFIKFATVALLPLIGAVMILRWTRGRSIPWRNHVFIRKIEQYLLNYQADIASFLMMLPLFTPRSQQFHPWYLIWSLAFLPLGRSRLWRALLLALSVTSTFRYIPLMFNGWEYTPLIQSQMRLMTWSGVLLGGVTWAALHILKRSILKSSR